MNIYLLDTNILSEPTKITPHEKVLQKLADNLEYSCISAVTWAEMLSGIKALPDGKRKTGLLLEQKTGRVSQLIFQQKSQMIAFRLEH